MRTYKPKPKVYNGYVCRDQRCACRHGDDIVKFTRCQLLDALEALDDSGADEIGVPIELVR